MFYLSLAHLSKLYILDLMYFLGPIIQAQEPVPIRYLFEPSLISELTYFNMETFFSSNWNITGNVAYQYKNVESSTSNKHVLTK